MIKYAATNIVFMEYLANINVLSNDYDIISELDEIKRKKSAIYIPLEILSSEYTISTMQIRMHRNEDVECEIKKIIKVLRGLNDNLIVKYPRIEKRVLNSELIEESKLYGISFSFDEEEVLFNQMSDDRIYYLFNVPYSIRILDLTE